MTGRVGMQLCKDRGRTKGDPEPNKEKKLLILGTTDIKEAEDILKLGLLFAVSYTHLTLPTIYSV